MIKRKKALICLQTNKASINICFVSIASQSCLVVYLTIHFSLFKSTVHSQIKKHYGTWEQSLIMLNMTFQYSKDAIRPTAGSQYERARLWKQIKTDFSRVIIRPLIAWITYNRTVLSIKGRRIINLETCNGAWVIHDTTLSDRLNEHNITESIKLVTNQPGWNKRPSKLKLPWYDPQCCYYSWNSLWISP